jgi:GNAT superfamily N-acetyltransferase
MTDVLTLRLAVPADLSAVDTLLMRSYPALLSRDYAPSTRVLALPIIARARPDLLASGTYWLAIDGQGKVVGAGGWSRGAPVGGGAGPAETGHVRHVATDAAMVRRGIGRALMRQVIDQASAAGIRRLDCLSTRTAVPFYAALGFRVLGPVDVPLRPGIVFPAVRMLREI